MDNDSRYDLKEYRFPELDLLDEENRPVVSSLTGFEPGDTRYSEEWIKSFLKTSKQIALAY